VKESQHPDGHSPEAQKGGLSGHRYQTKPNKSRLLAMRLSSPQRFIPSISELDKQSERQSSDCRLCSAERISYRLQSCVRFSQSWQTNRAFRAVAGALLMKHATRRRFITSDTFPSRTDLWSDTNGRFSRLAPHKNTAFEGAWSLAVILSEK
jgi:hypothetical protein